VYGYLNPSRLRPSEPLELLTTEGEQQTFPLKDLRAVYFVREFPLEHDVGRKAFLSRPKLDGLWVRLKYQDGETLEGIVPNDLLVFLDSGIQIIPPDLNGFTLRIFVPRTSLAELTVLGVIGGARRKPAPAHAAQPKLFSE
jgi:hypothetical protein